MSDLARPLPLSRQWQFPLLLASGALFAAGFWRFLPRSAPTLPADELNLLQARLRGGEFAAVHDGVQKLLAAPDLRDARRAVLEKLLAHAVHGAERPAAVHSADNARRVIESLRTAERLGSPLEPGDLLCMGDAWDWLGQAAAAIDSYERAIDAGARPASGLRRSVLRWLEALPDADPQRIEQQIQSLLTDPRTDAPDLLWAFRRKLDSFLAAGQRSEAEQLIAATADRLIQAGQKPELEYARARCLVAAGNPDEADRLLRELLSTGPRDDLWARAALLLARIQDGDARGEAALALYDEIQDAFPGGARYVEAQQGRADALIGLKRYEEALSALSALVDAARSAGEADTVDRDVLRAGLLSLAELLRGDGQAELGLSAVRLAGRLVDPDQTPQQLALLRSHAALAASLAASLAEQPPRSPAPAAASQGAPARDGASDVDESDPGRRRRELYIESAEANQAAAQLSARNAGELADDLWRAIDAFEAAGAMKRAARLLEQFIEDLPTEPRRVTALLRLGRVRQAVGDHGAAIAAYERLLREYPRTPDSLAALVPFANCLLARGGDDARRGESLLMQMVEDRTSGEPLCDPTAPEYADALFRLIELNYDQRRYEDVIFRTDAFLALRPGDPRAASALFLQADCYRRSAAALSEEAGRTPDLDRRQRIQEEAARRFARAEHLFGIVIEGADGESGDRGRLKAAWLYRGDCLFDQGRYAEAQDVYAEAAWRFDNELAAVSALMQVVHCQQRMGRPAEARSSLARLSILVQKMPEAAFADSPGAPGKQYWLDTVDRLASLGPT